MTVERLISANPSEVLKFNRDELKESIVASEGRVVLSENVVQERVVDNITTSEVSAAFGADMILLNLFDVYNPAIYGLKPENFDEDPKNIIHLLRELTGRPIGVNLEPVDPDINMVGKRSHVSPGRKASKETIIEAQKMGFDFLCLTGNPGSGISNEKLVENIKIARENFDGLIIAGKMHAGGATEKLIDLETAASFIDAGTDVILIPAVGTVASFRDHDMQEIADFAHEKETLIMSTVGTSQEGSGADYIERLAVRNKINGADIQHIGDAAWGICSPLETIFAMSKAIRGMSHTVAKMSRSIRR